MDFHRLLTLSLLFGFSFSGIGSALAGPEVAKRGAFEAFKEDALVSARKQEEQTKANIATIEGLQKKVYAALNACKVIPERPPSIPLIITKAINDPEVYLEDLPFYRALADRLEKHPLICPSIDPKTLSFKCANNLTAEFKSSHGIKVGPEDLSTKSYRGKHPEVARKVLAEVGEEVEKIENRDFCIEKAKMDLKELSGMRRDYQWELIEIQGTADGLREWDKDKARLAKLKQLSEFWLSQRPLNGKANSKLDQIRDAEYKYGTRSRLASEAINEQAKQTHQEEAIGSADQE